MGAKGLCRNTISAICSWFCPVAATHCRFGPHRRTSSQVSCIFKKYYFSLTHVTSLSLRIASLKHEDSSIRRIYQDLRPRKSANVQADRSSSATSTLSDEPHRLQPRASLPAQSRTTSVASPIRETPQRLHQSGKDTAAFIDPTATSPVIPEQPPHSIVSSASQLDDDIRRRSSLDDMVS